MNNLIWLLMTIMFYSYSRAQSLSSSDTVFVEEGSFWLNLPDGNMLCNLLYNDTHTNFDYYRIKGQDSLIYCMKYYKGILSEEGIMCLYKATDKDFCWGKFAVWKFYNSAGSIDHLEYINRDIKTSPNILFEFTSKFTVICRDCK